MLPSVVTTRINSGNNNENNTTIRTKMRRFILSFDERSRTMFLLFLLLFSTCLVWSFTWLGTSASSEKGTTSSSAAALTTLPDDATSTIRTSDVSSSTSSSSSTKKNDDNPPIQTIALIGERNSGTTWMLKELRRCYSKKYTVLNHLTRHKHYFQDADETMRIQKFNQTLVVAEFRHPYQFVLAMVDKPRRTTDHRSQDWYTFVTTPWTTKRAASDLKYANTTGRVCQEKFRYKEVVPCEKNPAADEYVIQKSPRSKPQQSIPIYELKRDGSGEPYKSIVDLRADKIRNHVLDVRDFAFVEDVVVVRYEDLLRHGTAPLHKQITEVTGTLPHCEATPPQPDRPQRPVTDEFKQWMDEHVDWEAEALIGYTKS